MIMTNVEVLIVEDDPMVVEVNKEFVSRISGFQVSGVAKTGSEALIMVNENKYDLALIDIYLPDIDGFTVLKEIRKNGVSIDVIMVTAVQEAEIVQNVFRYGAVDYIIKPFKFARLKNALITYYKMHNCFDRKTVLSQNELDQLAIKRGTEMGNSDDLPKGLNNVTLKQVLMCLIKQIKPVSADEVAKDLGLARVTARRYLEYLEVIDKVKVEFKYGSVGRPIKKFILKDFHEQYELN